MPATAPSALDAKHSAFITRGVSVLVASRHADNRPVVNWACGCVDSGTGRITVFVHAATAEQLLRAVTDCGIVAAVFSEPATHETIQLKGNDAEVVEATEQDLAFIAACRDEFVGKLEGLGYSRAMARKLVGTDQQRVSGIQFTPTAVYDQTPGPHAGEPIRR